MKLISALNKIKRVYKIAAFTVLMAVLSIAAFYMGWTNTLDFFTPLGDVAIYSRFDFALIPMGLGLFVFFIIGMFYIFTEERWEDRYGPVLPLSTLAFAGIALVLVLITPSINESKYEKAGLQSCSSIPTGYLPLFAKKFAVDPSLCK
ncbi:DUF2079 domain-containing protein [Vibrio sp. VNB-15]